MNSCKHILWVVLMCLAGTMSAQAADHSSQPLVDGWYGGVRGGVPFGISTFSSFGADKTRAGWTAGVYGGYRFNPVLALEVSAAWGKVGLSAQQCCIDKGYWLGADGVRYSAAVLDAAGWPYSDLKSKVCLQQYGLHLNFNVLGLFASTRESRWSLNLAPAIYAASTKATVKAISDDATAISGSAKWHCGLGGDLMAEYRIARHLSVGLYSGLTYLTGKRMDGAPQYRHKNNYLWESGVRIGWTFGTCKKHQAAPVEAVTPAPAPAPAPAPKPQPAPAPAPTPVVEQPATPVLEFPVIYFSFNSVWIEESERGKVTTIADTLKANPDARVTVTGYADSVGAADANQRVSLARAEAVKEALVKAGIDASRITTSGGGVDTAATTPTEARHAVTVQIK